MTETNHARIEDSDRRERIWQVTNDCLRRLECGVEMNDESVIRKYPDLMPELAEELQNVRVIQAARRRFDQLSGGENLADDIHQEGLRVRCPHCRGCVEVADDAAFAAMICSSCGSSFSLVDDDEQSASKDKPKRIAHFELLEQVGSGGFGTVWKAYDTELDRVVAVKIPRREQLDAAHVQMLLREARAAAQLMHPSIVTVYEVGREDDTVYIVTDLVEGITLSEWLDTHPCSPRDAGRLVQTIAGALHAAHQAGVVHRDLKPQNVMIDAASQPHIMDFGLARRESGEITMTVDGQVLGTPAYMPPEQAQGEAHHVDRRADIYSLGVILFELLTGELPFRGNPRMLARQVIHDEPPSPRKLNHRVPRDLETICLKCLEKEPANRFDTARELSDELGRFLVGQPLHARPVGRIVRAGRWCHRNPIVSSLTCGLLLTLLVGILAVATQWMRADQAAARATRQSAQLALDRGIRLCEQGKMDRGIIWLGRSLELAPANATDMHRIIRENMAGWRGELNSIQLLLTHPSAVHAVAFTADGSQIITGAVDGTVRFWDSQTGRRLDSSIIHEPGVHCLAISQDGAHLVTGTGSYNAARLWDTRTGRLIRQLDEHESGVVDVEFSPDGQRFVTGSADGGSTAWLWNASTGEPWNSPLTGHTHTVAGVAFSPDGNRIATASWDKTVRIWNANTGKAVGEPFPHQHWVWTVGFTAGGSAVLAGCDDGTLHLWDVERGERVWTRPAHEGPLRALAVSADGQRILTGAEDNCVRLWDARTGEQIGSVMQHQAIVLSVRFNPADNNMVITGSLDHTARVWQLAPSRRPQRTIQYPGGLQAAALSPNGTRVLAGGKDNLAHMWDVTTGQQVGEPLHHDEWVTQAAFSPDGSRMLTGSGSEAPARLWQAGTGKLVGEFRGKGGAAFVAISPDGELVATGHWEPGGMARVWDAHGRLLFSLGHPNKVHAVAFDCTGKRLVTGCEDHTARLWDVSTGVQIGKSLEHHGPVRAVACSPSGGLIVTGCEDKTARIWDAATQSSIGSPLEHEGRVSAVAFSPDRRRVLTGSWDKTAQLWDVATSEPVGPPYRHNAAVRAVGFDRSGQTLITASDDGVIHVWDAPPSALKGDVSQIVRWTQIATGLELDDNGAVRALDSDEWRRRRAQESAPQRMRFRCSKKTNVRFTLNFTRSP